MEGLTQAAGVAPEIERIWRRRGAQLAERPALAATAGDAFLVLVVSIGSERYGIALKDTTEVLAPRPVTAIPGALPGFAGVINVHGEICAVIDLPLLLGIAPAFNGGTARVVLISQGEQVAGLLVDTVEHVRCIARAELQGCSQGGLDLPSRYLKGLTRDLLRLLRTESLFPAPDEGAVL